MLEIEEIAWDVYSLRLFFPSCNHFLRDLRNWSSWLIHLPASCVFFPLRTPCPENWTVHPCFFVMFCFVITILHHHLGKYLLPVPSIMAKQIQVHLDPLAKHFQTTPMALDDRGATFRITQLCRATCQTPRRSLRFFYGKCPPFSPKKKQNWSLWGGEFSAKIFLKHWYLQCFPAMKALKPLF